MWIFVSTQNSEIQGLLNLCKVKIRRPFPIASLPVSLAVFSFPLNDIVSRAMSFSKTFLRGTPFPKSNYMIQRTASSRPADSSSGKGWGLRRYALEKGFPGLRLQDAWKLLARRNLRQCQKYSCLSEASSVFLTLLLADFCKLRVSASETRKPGNPFSRAYLPKPQPFPERTPRNLLPDRTPRNSTAFPPKQRYHRSP